MDIRRITVIGSGTMGRGIAYVSAQAGFATVVHDIDDAALDRARKATDDLFAKAVAYENKVSFEDTAMQGRKYTWSPNETLTDLLARKDEILDKHRKAMEQAAKHRKNIPLIQVLADALDEDDDSEACVVCQV